MIQKAVTHLLQHEPVLGKDLARMIRTLVATKLAVNTGLCSSRSEDSDPLSSPVLSETGTAHQGSKVRSLLVDLTSPLLEPNSKAKSGTSSRVRCLQLRLGGNLPRSENREQVHILRSETMCQLLEIEGNLSDLAVLPQGQFRSCPKTSLL